MTIRRILHEAGTLTKPVAGSETYPVLVISEGKGSSGTYGRALLEEYGTAFDNKPSFMNHPLDPEKPYDLVVKTNCGTFTITLDQAGAPATSASLVALASDGFYDNTIFHRIVPGFVIQGGDPTQTGSGGPGYKTVDVPS